MLVDSVTAGAALAVDVLCGCFWSQPTHALVACAQLLSPDSNQALDVRLAAVRGTPQLLTYTTAKPDAARKQCWVTDSSECV